MENIRRYFRRTDKTYLLLCIFSSVMLNESSATVAEAAQRDGCDSAFELGSQAGQWLCRG